MNRLNHDGHDASQYLPLKMVENYAKRFVDVGKKIWNGRSILPGIADLMPVERLALPKDKGGEEILNESHKTAGINFHIICNCAEGRPMALGVDDSPEMAFISPVLKKMAIESQLRPGDKHIVRRVIIYPVFAQDYAQFQRNPGRLVEAFDALVDAMYKENIKIALDDIRRNAKMLNRSRATSVSRINQPALVS